MHRFSEVQLLQIFAELARFTLFGSATQGFGEKQPSGTNQIQPLRGMSRLPRHLLAYSTLLNMVRSACGDSSGSRSHQTLS
jgi:hypothetical protein